MTSPLLKYVSRRIACVHISGLCRGARLCRGPKWARISNVAMYMLGIGSIVGDAFGACSVAWWFRQERREAILSASQLRRQRSVRRHFGENESKRLAAECLLGARLPRLRRTGGFSCPFHSSALRLGLGARRAPGTCPRQAAQCLGLLPGAEADRKQEGPESLSRPTHP